MGGLNSRRWEKARRAALERDGWRCTSCGKAGCLEVDHKVPLKLGGPPYDLANLQSLCIGCHLVKSAEEYSVKRDWNARGSAQELVTALLEPTDGDQRPGLVVMGY